MRKLLKKIQSVKILKLDDDDIIMVKFYNSNSANSMERALDSIKIIFAKLEIKNEIFAHDSSMDIEIIKKENKNDL